MKILGLNFKFNKKESDGASFFSDLKNKSKLVSEELLNRRLKTCVSCMFYEYHPNSANGQEMSECKHPSFIEINPVDGKEKIKNAWCDLQRGSRETDNCGINGRFWEAKKVDILDKSYTDTYYQV